MNYEVYSYWNIEELQGVFNAIAALTASNDFTGLLRVLALIAIASMALAVLAGRARHEDFWRWVFMVAVINGLMIVPKASVILVDRTSTQPPRVVANVPIGLAVIAHTTSKIGDWLTRSFETVFSLPSDIQFNKNGFLFGHRILTEVQNLSPDTVSGVWMKDFQEFWRECVTPDIENGVLSPDTLRTTTDIMGALNNTNPALYVTLSTVGTVPCNPTAYNDLNNRLNNQVVPALLNRLGEITFPANPLKNTLIQNAIMTAYSHSQVMNNTAQTIVRQAVMQVATVNAYCNVFAQVGDSNRAALCYATARGANLTNFTYQVLSKIAESSMPKLKSAIEMIQYAVFPLIVAFAIVAGHMALPIIRTYVMSMVWVQLWPPLYAIVHYIMSVKMKTYGAQLGPYAGTLAGQADLINMSVSDQAIAGMLVVAIPPIAAALVKGGEIGLQAVAGLVSATRTAEKQAAATAKGVEAIGDWAVHQRVTTQMQDGTMKTSFSDGSYVVSSEPAYSRIGISSSLSTSVASQLTQKASETTNAAINQAIAAGEKISSALDTVGRLAQSHRRGESFGQGFSEADTSAVTKAYSEANQIAKDFARSLGISEREAIQVLATVSAGGGLTVVKGMLQSAGSSEAAKLDENRFSEISKIATDFRNAIDRVNQIAKKAEFSTSETADISALKEVSASLGQSKEFSKNASANFQISQALQREASLAESNRFEFSRNMTNEFMSFMEKQINPFTGRNFTKEDVAQMDAKNQELLVPYMQKFAQEQAEKIASGYKNNASGINPQAFYDQNSAVIAGQAGNVTAFGTTNIGRVESAATGAGIHPAGSVDSRGLPGKTQQGLAEADTYLDKRERRIGQAVDEHADKTAGVIENPNLADRAAANAPSAIGNAFVAGGKAIVNTGAAVVEGVAGFVQNLGNGSPTNQQGGVPSTAAPLPPQGGAGGTQSNQGNAGGAWQPQTSPSTPQPSSGTTQPVAGANPQVSGTGGQGQPLVIDVKGYDVKAPGRGQAAGGQGSLAAAQAAVGAFIGGQTMGIGAQYQPQGGGGFAQPAAASSTAQALAAQAIQGGNTIGTPQNPIGTGQSNSPAAPNQDRQFREAMTSLYSAMSSYTEGRLQPPSQPWQGEGVQQTGSGQGQIAQPAPTASGTQPVAGANQAQPSQTAQPAQPAEQQRQAPVGETPIGVGGTIQAANLGGATQPAVGAQPEAPRSGEPAPIQVEPPSFAQPTEQTKPPADVDRSAVDQATMTWGAQTTGIAPQAESSPTVEQPPQSVQAVEPTKPAESSPVSGTTSTAWGAPAVDQTPAEPSAPVAVTEPYQPTASTEPPRPASTFETSMTMEPVQQTVSTSPVAEQPQVAGTAPAVEPRVETSVSVPKVEAEPVEPPRQATTVETSVSVPMASGTADTAQTNDIGSQFNPFEGTPGRSNLGNILGNRPMPPIQNNQYQQVAEAREAANKGDAPPPSQR